MNGSKRKMLIVGPHYSDPGGVVSYLKAILPCIKEQYEVDYLPVGSYGVKYFSFLIDQIKLPLCLMKSNYDLVYFNPSFNLKSFLRDGTFISIANLFGRKTLIFVHGWEETFEARINGPLRLLFNSSFKKATSIIVLSPDFKNVLDGWGCQNVYVDTTIVPDGYADEVEVRNKLDGLRRKKGLKILFLSRLVDRKGALETLEACKRLIKKGLDIRLSIAGDGPLMPKIKKTISMDEELEQRIYCLGDVRGADKIKVLMDHDCFCFPTYYWEGLPIALLEAMSFGLPIITSPSGGIKDRFLDPEMGFLVPGKEIDPIVSAIEKLYRDKELCVKIGNFNHNYALQHFSASSVFNRIGEIYKRTIES